MAEDGEKSRGNRNGRVAVVDGERQGVLTSLPQWADGILDGSNVF